MNQQLSGTAAGIFFSEYNLRYAVVNHDTGRSVRRLGSCEFEFDVLRGFKSRLTDKQESTVVQALTDVLGQSNLDRIHVATHPGWARTYFTLVDSALDSRREGQQYDREARLLFSESDSYHSVARSLHHVVEEGTEQRHDWKMVTLIPTSIKENVDRILARAEVPEPVFFSSTEAARNIVVNGHDSSNVTEGFALLIGQYDKVVEMSVLHDGVVVHGHTVAPKTAEDYLYWVVVLTTRLDLSPALIEHVYLYGDHLDASLPEQIVRTIHAETVRIDPFAFGEFRVDALRPDFDAVPYTTCLGAAI